MDKNWIYINEKNNRARYVLGYSGKRTLCCMGINSSTAKPNDLDPTLKSVERIALANGYDSFLMFNVYPKRNTVFEDLPHKVNEKYEKRNVEEIVKAVKALPCKVDFWLAYGNLIEGRDYLLPALREILQALENISNHKINYLCAGINKTGHPKHPLYLPKDSKLQKFDLKKLPK
ncbi:MAG: DUF1643 domain-containing protein [Coriobacteriales bacterium]|nr:DUF1643 domain-containing protein [Coriobacteriales bacterium]